MSHQFCDLSVIFLTNTPYLLNLEQFILLFAGILASILFHILKYFPLTDLLHIGIIESKVLVGFLFFDLNTFLCDSKGQTKPTTSLYLQEMAKVIVFFPR
jgi:hypothetical protein